METQKTFGFKMPRWEKYNNAEFAGLLHQLSALATAVGADAVKCQQDLLTSLAAADSAMTEMVAQTRASVLTQQIAEKDEEVNRLVRYIFATLKAQASAPAADVRNAAKAVIIVIAPYKNAEKKPYAEQNQLLRGMLHDLSKDSDNVNKAALTDAVAALAVALAEMGILIDQRNVETVANDLGEVKTQRDWSSALLDTLFCTAVANHYIDATDALADFIDNAEQIVKSADNALAHRLAALKKQEDEAEEQTNGSETPEA